MIEFINFKAGSGLDDHRLNSVNELVNASYCRIGSSLSTFVRFCGNVSKDRYKYSRVVVGCRFGPKETVGRVRQPRPTARAW